MFECSCDSCKSACERKPGWFAPGQAERVAEAMGTSLKTLFDQHLMVDWWCADDEIAENTFVLSPAIIGYEGREAPGSAEGRCIFFKNGGCEIHTLGKPIECAELTHDGKASHVGVAQQWIAHQGQIRDLLEREPETEDYTIFDLLQSFMGRR